MKLTVALLATAVALVGCGESEAEFVPPGQYAGSTAADRAFKLEVSGDEPKVNQHKARYVERGVIEYKDGGVVTRMTCKKLDEKAEQLRCTLRITPPGSTTPTTEVIDLMLL